VVTAIRLRGFDCEACEEAHAGPAEARGAAGERLRPCHPQGMWFLVGMDVTLDGGPSLAGLYGPFDGPEAARAYQPCVEENGTLLVITEATDPARYPWTEPDGPNDLSP
jgi:hypothetical protein